MMHFVKGLHPAVAGAPLAGVGSGHELGNILRINSELRFGPSNSKFPFRIIHKKSTKTDPQEAPGKTIFAI